MRRALILFSFLLVCFFVRGKVVEESLLFRHAQFFSGEIAKNLSVRTALDFRFSKENGLVRFHGEIGIKHVYFKNDIVDLYYAISYKTVLKEIVSENRPYIDIGYKINKVHVTVDNRYRVEYRLIGNEAKLRYRGKFIVLFRASNEVGFGFGPELFFSDRFERMRFYTYFKAKASKSGKVSILFGLYWQGDAADNNSFSEEYKSTIVPFIMLSYKF